MRRGVLLTAAAVLLVGPTVLAFFSGGYFDGPRFVATILAWTLVLVAALLAPEPVPRSTGGRVALAGLALLATWTGASIAWAPLSESATDAFVRLLLYVGVLVAGAALLRDPRALRAVEPVLAAGAVVVIGYGLAGRLLPELVELEQSATALGRLEQPITYWNAEGALAAIGLVLCARIAGTPSMPAASRVAAAAACAPLGMGVYLSFSRGAIAACLAGLVLLVAAAPTAPQLRAAVTGLAAAVAGAVAGGIFEGVASLAGSVSDRQADGAIALGLLALVMAATAAAQWRACAAERRAGDPLRRLALAPRLPVLAAVVVGVGLAGLVAAGLSERGDREELSDRTGISRLASADSRRYDYWRVALDAFAEQPLQGVGAGGFRAEWVRERPVREAALEAHSLPLEIAAELGLTGLIAFGMFAAGVAAAGRRALRERPELGAGPVAAATVFALHAAIDWDWQLPAVTLPALILAAALVAVGEPAPLSRPAAPRAD